MNKTEIFFFINLPIFLTSLIPFFLITGPFLSDLSVSICAIIFLVNSYKNSLVSYYKNYFFALLFLFWLALLISSLQSNYILVSLKTSFFYIRFIIFALSTWYLFKTNNKLIINIFYCLLICFCILIFDSYYQFFFNNNLLGWPIHGTRVSSFFGDELILGSYLSRLFPFLFASLIYLNNKDLISKKYFYFFAIIFVLSDILVFLSGERSAFFYLNFSTFFLIIFLTNYNKLRLITFFISIILIFIISIYSPKYKTRMIDNTIQNSFLNKKEYTFDKKRPFNNIFSFEHSALYNSAYQIFLENKLVGIGPKLFRYECKDKNFFVNKFSCSTHPHNTYVQLLAEVGIVGFLIVFSFFLIINLIVLRHLIFKFFYKVKKLSDFQIALMACVMITLWPFVPTGNFFNNWLSVIYFLPLGFLFKTFEKN